MKAKPILITAGILVLAAVIFLFVRGRNLNRPEKNEVFIFLTAFNNQVKQGNIDSLHNYFEVNQKTKILNRLINVLANKTSLKDNNPPLFNLSLTIDQSRIRILNSELAEAVVPVSFTNDSVAPKTSVLKLKVHKVSAHNYKIVQVNATKFSADYLAFENLVRSKILTDKDIYSPITLQAFETAKQLKTRYDSVIWFAHLDQKNFFYVVKGKWDMDNDLFLFHNKDTVIEPYKMGLVGPDLKEVIPAEYDLIHNISGTFPGLVEVEKDGKKGFYNLYGKIVIPVNYEQIFPIDDDNNLAVLRNGDDYFYLKKDTTISGKTDLKYVDFFPKIRKIAGAFNLYKNALSVVTEYNSREIHGAVYVAPSYLVDLNLAIKEENFKNPLRKNVDQDVHTDYNVSFSTEINDPDNILEASFYSIRDYYLGGRSEFYDTKNIVIIDKKKNRVFTQEIGTDYSAEEGFASPLEASCDISSIRVVNDSLFELKSGAGLSSDLYDSTKTVTGGPYYHYLVVKNDKLVELRDNRIFGFTKYIKMDDSYLNGCYLMLVGSGDYNKRKQKTVDRITPEMLRFMKNEIYADYGYQFKDKRWMDVFQNMDSYGYDRASGGPKKPNASVDDSLTEIDKYNINWITQKLKSMKSNTLASK